MQLRLEHSHLTSAIASISYKSFIPFHLLIIPSQSPSQLALLQPPHIIFKKRAIRSTLRRKETDQANSQLPFPSQIMILPHSILRSSLRTSPPLSNFALVETRLHKILVMYFVGFPIMSCPFNHTPVFDIPKFMSSQANNREMHYPSKKAILQELLSF